MKLNDVFVIALTALITACGGGGGGSSSATASNTCKASGGHSGCCSSHGGPSTAGCGAGEYLVDSSGHLVCTDGTSSPTCTASTHSESSLYGDGYIPGRE